MLEVQYRTVLKLKGTVRPVTVQRSAFARGRLWGWPLWTRAAAMRKRVLIHLTASTASLSFNICGDVTTATKVHGVLAAHPV